MPQARSPLALSKPRAVRPASGATAPGDASVIRDPVTQAPITQPPQGPATEAPGPSRAAEVISLSAPFAPGAEGAIDDSNFAPLPLRRDAGRGMHRVVVRAPGRRTFQSAVVVLEGQPLDVELTEEEFPPLMGGIYVEVQRSDGTPVLAPSVRLDGIPIAGPPFTRPVVVGAHDLEVSADGYGAQRFQVSIDADRAHRFIVKLSGEGGVSAWVGVAVAVAAVAAGAAIAQYVGGRGEQ